MASSTEFEEELICPIDSEFYDNPIQLKCLHILCKKDIDKMIDENQTIQCPICNAMSQEKDIKPDFRIKKNTKLLTPDKEIVHGIQLCGFCKGEEGTYKCKQCEMFIGKVCLKEHMKIQKHACVAVEELKKAGKREIQKVLEGMDQLAAPVSKLKSQWESTKSKFEAEVSAIFLAIDQSENEIVSNTRRRHDELRQELLGVIAKENRTCNTMLESLDEKISVFTKDKKLLNYIVSENDTRTLIDPSFIAKTVAEANRHCIQLKSDSAEEPNAFDLVLSPNNIVIQQINELNIESVQNRDSENRVPGEQSTEKYSRASQPVAQEETATRNKRKGIAKSWPVTKTAQPTSAESETLKHDTKKHEKHGSCSMVLAIEKSSKLPVVNTFLDFMGRKISSEVVYKFREKLDGPVKITAMGDHLWVIRECSDIDILKCNGDGTIHFVRKISVQDSTTSGILAWRSTIIYKVRSVGQALDGAIIAGCDGALEKFISKCKRRTGLVIIDEHGVIRQVIEEREYLDVKTDNQYIYGLVSPGTEVTIHEKQSQNWVNVRQVKPPDTHCYSGLCIYKHILMLSDNWYSKIAKYDLDRNKMTSLGEKGEDMGQFVSPEVTVCDKDGNIVICDFKNDRLQILKTDKTLHAVALEGKLGGPIDMTIDCHGHFFVINVLSKTLVRLHVC